LVEAGRLGGKRSRGVRSPRSGAFSFSFSSSSVLDVKRQLVPLALALAVVVGGCGGGGSGVSGAERTKAKQQLTELDATLAQALVNAKGDVPTMEQATIEFVDAALVLEEKVGTDELKRHFVRDANAMETWCRSCARMIDRARDSL
jgi:hypothetical protein